jgi:hypothetical protein
MSRASLPIQDENAEPPRRPVTVRPLFLLPIFVVLVEIALRFMPAGYMVRTANARLAEILSLPAPQVQIMGDSVSAAINSANLAEAAGLPAGSVQNYSVPGTSPVFAYYTLKREIDAGRTPATILYAPHPANLETPMVDRFVGRLGAPAEDVDLFRHGVTLPEWLFGACCRASIAMRYREEMRVAFTEGDFGFFTTLRTPTVSVAASQTPIPATVQAANRPAFSAASFPPQLSTPFFLDPVNRNYIGLFCDLAGSKGIVVCWVTMPVNSTFAGLAMKGQAGEDYENFLTDLAARHANVRLLHPQIEIYPDSDFADPWHLNPHGALKFSTELGVALAPKSESH